MKAYPENFRLRVVAAVDGGMPRAVSCSSSCRALSVRQLHHANVAAMSAPHRVIPDEATPRQAQRQLPLTDAAPKRATTSFAAGHPTADLEPEVQGATDGGSVVELGAS